MKRLQQQSYYPLAVPEFEISQPKSTHPAERDCTRSSKQTLRVYLDKGRVSEQKQQVTRQGAVPENLPKKQLPEIHITFSFLRPAELATGGQKIVRTAFSHRTHFSLTSGVAPQWFHGGAIASIHLFLTVVHVVRWCFFPPSLSVCLVPYQP